MRPLPSVPFIYPEFVRDVREVADLYAEERVRTAVLEAFRLGLQAGLGADMAPIAFDDVLQRCDEPNTVAAERLKKTRAAISKALIKARRNLGLPETRYPENARDGAAPRGVERKTKLSPYDQYTLLFREWKLKKRAEEKAAEGQAAIKNNQP